MKRKAFFFFTWNCKSFWSMLSKRVQWKSAKVRKIQFDHHGKYASNSIFWKKRDYFLTFFEKKRLLCHFVNLFNSSFFNYNLQFPNNTQFANKGRSLQKKIAKYQRLHQQLLLGKIDVTGILPYPKVLYVLTYLMTISFTIHNYIHYYKTYWNLLKIKPWFLPNHEKSFPL